MLIALRKNLSDAPTVCGVFRLQSPAWKDAGKAPITNCGSPTCRIVLVRFPSVFVEPQEQMSNDQ